MNRTKIFTCVCMLAVAAVMPGTARADAESTAARCVGKIQQTVDRSGFVVADRTTETVHLINRLLNVGRVEAAIAAGRACVQETRQDLRLAANYIDDVANECLRKLVRMEEYQLARRVDYARNAAIDKLGSMLDRQEWALSDALGN
jgi:hypothetical protein